MLCNFENLCVCFVLATTNSRVRLQRFGEAAGSTVWTGCRPLCLFAEAAGLTLKFKPCQLHWGCLKGDIRILGVDLTCHFSVRTNLSFLCEDVGEDEVELNVGYWPESCIRFTICCFTWLKLADMIAIWKLRTSFMVHETYWIICSLNIASSCS